MKSSPTANNTQLSPLDRLLSLTCEVKAGEGRSVMLLFCMVFLFLVTAYLLKPVREALILVNGGAEVRSYAIAAQALLLVFILPLYGLLFKHSNKQLMMQTVVATCIACILSFYILFYRLDYPMPVAFYIWLGLFAVLILAQFWAFASDLFNEDTGKRLFATIALGASAGAWTGSAMAKGLIAQIGPDGILLVCCVILAVTLFIVPLIEQLIPEHSQAVYTPRQQQIDQDFLSGFKLVLGSRYLIAIAVFVVLFNWINSTGDFVLSAWVEVMAEEAVGKDNDIAKSNYIGEFYSDFYLYVNLAGFLIQGLLVSRIIKVAGVSLALLILPIIMFIGYTGMFIVPVFTLFYVLRVSENSIGYSLQNTLRQILFLPTSKQVKYEARSVIETFFWRVGDVLQGIVVYLGYNVFELNWSYFIALNIGLSFILILMILRIGWHYRGLSNLQHAEIAAAQYARTHKAS